MLLHRSDDRLRHWRGWGEADPITQGNRRWRGHKRDTLHETPLESRSFHHGHRRKGFTGRLYPSLWTPTVTSARNDG
jgi:hypothetical protein